ncbi:MAG: hypothetical protein Q8P73_02265 [bacterium]|nr:hypothetical protein [bacterium]
MDAGSPDRCPGQAPSGMTAVRGDETVRHSGLEPESTSWMPDQVRHDCSPG